MAKYEWEERRMGEEDYGSILSGDGFYLSYQPNKLIRKLLPSAIDRGLDSFNPETAVVILDGKGPGETRYLIFRGDRREELQKLMPDLDKLKEYWKKEGGHFYSDDLDDDTEKV